MDDGTPELRPAPVRRAQALSEVLRRYLVRGAAVPRDGGARPQIGVTIRAVDLACGTDRAAGGLRNSGTGPAADGGWHRSAVLPAGPAHPPNLHGVGGSPSGGSAALGGRGICVTVGQFDSGGPVSLAVARMLACDGDLIRLLVGADSAILDEGRAVRLFTRAQRRALIARDKGCAFPSCDAPAAWCEAHHITFWSAGGESNLANGVLLCRRHHMVIHQEQWRIDLGDQHPEYGAEANQSRPSAERGAETNQNRLSAKRDTEASRGNSRSRPWFIPPRYIDPKRHPRRNNHFYLPEFLTIVSRR